MTWLGDHSWLAAAVFWALLIGGSWGRLGYGWLRGRKRQGDDDR
jgi:hypothetical protein